MTSKMTNSPFRLGSVSSGALRDEGLLERFIQTLESLDSAKEHAKLIQEARNYLAMFYNIPWDDPEDTYDLLLDEISIIVNEDLWDALNSFCPPYVYFGAHPREGAGFWPDLEALQEDIRYEADTIAEGEYHIISTNVIAQVSDHGNITVMDADRNVLWSCV